MEALVSHCNGLFLNNGSLYLAFFIAGLTGGFTHCISMCGSFAACERMCATKLCSTTATIDAALSLKYHSGRMLTYGSLGFAVAMLSKQLAATVWWPFISSLMLIGAGVLFLLSSVHACLKHTHHQPFTKYAYARGILLGFMPCGLLYAALMMAATLANPLSALLAMCIFTLGTMPALLLLSGSADILSRKWHDGMQYLGRAMMVFNGLSLIVMAIRIMNKG